MSDEIRAFLWLGIFAIAAWLFELEEARRLEAKATAAGPNVVPFKRRTMMDPLYFIRPKNYAAEQSQPPQPTES